MLGKLGRSWAGAAIAMVVMAVAAFLVWRGLSGTAPPAGRTGDVLWVCPVDGERLLGPAAKPGGPPPACPKCSGEMVVARVFECQKGHLFVGYLEKPADPASAKTDDEYKKHQPRSLRPGFDKEWTAGGAGLPQCPVCRTGMKRPIVDVATLKLEDVQMGKLPAGGGGN